MAIPPRKERGITVSTSPKKGYKVSKKTRAESAVEHYRKMGSAGAIVGSGPKNREREFEKKRQFIRARHKRDSAQRERIYRARFGKSTSK